MRTLHRGARIVMRRASWRTLIECHDDIRTERTLHIHDTFWGEKMLRPIEIRAKVDSLFGDFREFFTALILHAETE